MNGKKIAIPIFLVVGIGVSAYLWSMASAENEDAGVSKKGINYTCANCQNKFTLTTEEGIAMRRSRGDIYCPGCDKAMANKDDVKVRLSGETFKSGNEEEATEEVTEEDPKPKLSGGAQKVPPR